MNAIERSTRRLRLLIVDPRQLWREALRLTLERLDDHVEVREAESVDEAAALLGEHPPFEIVVLHVESEHTEALERLQRQRGGQDPIPVVILGDAQDAEHAAAALGAGAKGYIPTSLDGAVMVEALHLVAAGGTYVPETVMGLLMSYAQTQVSQSANSERLDRVFLECTPRQRQVLDLLCRGTPNKVIAHELQISENTVKAHLRQIMKRLNVRNRTEAALIASGLAGHAPVAE